MCSTCDKKAAVVRAQNNLTLKAQGVNQRLAQQAYQQRMAQVLNNKIHQQQALTKKQFK